MDVVLIAGSLALSPYLPRYIAGSNHEQREKPLPSSDVRAAVPLLISTGISFLLLTLSVLEAIPSSWMMFLNEQSLPTAYRLLLAILVLMAFVVFPFAAGAQQQQILARFMQNTDNEKRQNQQSRCSYCNSMLFRLLVCLLRCMLSVTYCITYRPLRYLLFRRRSKKEKGELPIAATNSNNETNKNNKRESAGSAVDKKTEAKRNSTWNRIPQTVIGGVLGMVAVWSVFCVLGPWVVLTTEGTSFLTIAVSWLTAMGLLLSACINGFGSVSMPHSCLAGFYLEPISDSAVAKAQDEIHKATNSLKDRKDQLLSCGLSLQPGSSSSSFTSSNTTTNKRQSFADLGEELALRRKNLQTEIHFLETLIDEMKDEAEEMVQMKELAAGARTPMGRFKLWLGVVFSVVLLVRLFSAILFLWKHDHGSLDNIDEPKASGSDPITMILLWLVGHHYVTQQDYNTLSQFISCILTAILSFSQVRTFWRTVGSVNRWIQQICRKMPCSPQCGKQSGGGKRQSSSPSSTRAYENMIACLMGCYFLSCIVLTKLMLPVDYRVAFADALGGNTNTMFRIRSYAVNLIFTLSALVTTFVLGIILGIQRQNTVRHLSVWKSTSANLHNSVEP